MEAAVSQELANEFRAKLSCSAYKLSRLPVEKSVFESKRSEVIQCLRDQNLLVFKSDKGNSTVICSRQQYVDRMKVILRDPEKFCELSDPVDWNDTGSQQSLQRIVRDIVDKGQMPEDANKLIPTAAVVTRMYGLHKVHKQDFPCRPTLSMSGSTYHSLARRIDEWFFKPILHLFKIHTVQHSFQFSRMLQKKR